MQLAAYIGRRLLFIAPQLLGIVLVSFLLIKTIPGDPAVLMLGPTATPEAIASLRAKMGLDEPILAQFVIYVKALVHGDLGTSWQTTRPVLEDLLRRFPATVELVTFGLLIAILIGVPLGLAAAVNPTGWVARVVDIFHLVGVHPDETADLHLGVEK